MAKWPRFDPDADRRLARALGEGGEQPLATLYDIYAERLRDYCGSLIRDQRMATDIVHDTLIDAHRRVRRMRDRTRLRAWLYAAVRRRCLQRVRHPTLRLDRGGEPPDDAGGLLDAAFDRLDFLDQEALLLTLRHDLSGDDLGALLGIPARRASARTVRALARADEALVTARHAMAQRCATADESPPDHKDHETYEETYEDLKTYGDHDGSGDDTSDDQSNEADAPNQTTALADHMAGCADCRHRADLSLSALLDLVPPPALPPSLRHRVVHTGTDPELAGYRADIAARGGALNTEGLPRQPDIPSSVARRWLFTGGGVAGAAVSAVVAAFLIGPGTAIPGLVWPSYGPGPKATAPQPRPAERQPPPASATGPGRAGGAPGDPAGGVSRPPVVRSPAPAPTGVLAVRPSTIDFGWQGRAATLTMSVAHAPLTWHATTSTARVTLSDNGGKISAGETANVTVTFERGLIALPGQATITITDSAGGHRVVTVTWAGSLL